MTDLGVTVELRALMDMLKIASMPEYFVSLPTRRESESEETPFPPFHR